MTGSGASAKMKAPSKGLEGRCATAGGWPHHPKGGEVYAYHDHTTYPRIYGDDTDQRQKPPPWPVTVSFETFILLMG